MNPHQVINNKGKTVKIFRYSDNYKSWWDAKEKAENLAKKLRDKHKQWFGVSVGRKSDKPTDKKLTLKGVINIKPLSVNDAWKGRRFKTKAYKQYERDVLFQLKLEMPPPPPYRIDIEFGFTSSMSDIDNPVKCFMDILQKKYNINDKDVYEMNLKKVIVKNPYIKFNIYQLK